MVTWGQNQVFTFGGAAANASAPPTPAFGAAPPPPTFGSPSAGGGLFGSAPSSSAASASTLFGKPAAGSLFGATSPAPPGGSLFGAAPNAAAGGLFGAPAPPPLYGAPAPAAGGLFGAVAPPAGGLLGGAPGPPAIPAQAALQAHMDAEARQEAAKLQSSLEQLHHAYSGTSHQNPSPLVTIIYNNMTSEQLQWQFANQQSGGGYVIPPKPPQVAEQTWLEAIVNNPDRSTLIPVALIGAEALQARVGWQQQQASHYEQNVNMLTGAQQELQRRAARVRQNVMQLEQMHATLASRLLRLMNKVEVVRCMNLPLQPDEVNLAKRLQIILQQMDVVTKTLTKLQGTGSATATATTLPTNLELPDRQRLQQVFTEHRQSIIYLSETVQQDKRDIHLLKERVAR